MKLSEEVEAMFPALRVNLLTLSGIGVAKEHAELQNFKEEVCARVRGRYSLDSLKDVKVFRAYRDFFWKIGLDPTKLRPAAEALIRRILGGNPLPTINALVDSYNLASVDSEVALAAFDSDLLEGTLEMRIAKKGEAFEGIGMSQAMSLKGGEIVVSDAKRLIAIYPYRDADRSKVTETTKNVLLMVCGAPGIEEDRLAHAGKLASEYVRRFCGGVES